MALYIALLPFDLGAKFFKLLWCCIFGVRVCVGGGGLGVEGGEEE